MCEPTLHASEFFGSEVAHDLDSFKQRCDVIIANRWNGNFDNIVVKVFFRQILLLIRIRLLCVVFYDAIVNTSKMI